MTLVRRAYCTSAVLLPAMLAAAWGAMAQTSEPRSWMSRDDIIAAFVGRQLSGTYPNGTPWQEHIRPDGTSDYREGGSRHEGRWWMRGDHFCFSYPLPRFGGCFQVVPLGRNCYELYSVDRGDARQHWNGRMWRDDAPATCEEKPAV
jgi:hypothetical protein